MEGLDLLFYFLLGILMSHEFDKFMNASIVFEVRRNPEKYVETPFFKELRFYDYLGTILLVYGIFADPSWYCFLGILILSLTRIQYISVKWLKIDNILTVLLIILAYINYATDLWKNI